MKKVYEMSHEEMLEMLAKVIEKNPILEEKRNKINEETMKNWKFWLHNTWLI